jgi:hypothetical protein
MFGVFVVFLGFYTINGALRRIAQVRREGGTLQAPNQLH